MRGPFPEDQVVMATYYQKLAEHKWEATFEWRDEHGWRGIDKVFRSAKAAKEWLANTTQKKLAQLAAEKAKLQAFEDQQGELQKWRQVFASYQ